MNYGLMDNTFIILALICVVCYIFKDKLIAFEESVKEFILSFWKRS